MPEAAVPSQSIADKLKAARTRVEAVASTPPRPKPQATKLSEDSLSKTGVFGPLGSGKSMFLLGPLLAGEKVFGMSTDFGGNGLRSVANGLKELGRPELVDNLMNVDISEYRDAIDLLGSPEEFFPGLVEFDPTVFFWEGFSTFNNDLLDEETEVNKDMHGLGEGDKYAHWYDVKRATLRAMRKFFGLRLPNGKRLHKIMTFVEAKADVNDLTNVTEKAPMIQGSAKDLIAGGFDVVLNCYCEEKDGKFSYFYRCKGASGKYAVKNRGFKLQPIEAAEPERIWRVIAAKS
jgi:hypothetical protein